MGEIEQLALRRSRIIGALWLGALTLVAAHVLFQTLAFTTGHNHIFGLTRMFDLDEEANLPTWFSSVLLLIAGVLLARIACESALHRGTAQHYWWVLAAGFVFMSIDELAMVHELFNNPERIVAASTSTPLITYTWVIPYTVLVLGLGLYFLRFLAQLPLDTRIRFVVAGALYVGAALGVEFVEGAVVRLHGHDSVEDSALTTLQEALEISGVIVFIDALLRHVAAARRETSGTPAPATGVSPY